MEEKFSSQLPCEKAKKLPRFALVRIPSALASWSIAIG